MSDVVFYCNKVINDWIIKSIVFGFFASLYIVIIFGIISVLIVVGLLGEYYKLFTTNSAFTVVCYITLVSFIGLFIYLIQFKLRVLIDLKRFVDKEKINLKANNSIEDVVGTLNDLCDYIVNKPYTIPNLSLKISKFKSLKYKKEDR